MESLNRVIELPWLKELGGGLITGEVPKISEETLERVAEETAKVVSILSRNMVFISIVQLLLKQ